MTAGGASPQESAGPPVEGTPSGVGRRPRLVLVRHGQTTSNVAGALDTAVPGADLTDLGREQAAEVGRELAAEGVAPSVVCCSEAARARETAGFVGRALGVGVEVVPGVVEVQAGEFEMRDDPEAIAAYDDVLIGWLALGEREASLPGGESLLQVADRVLPVMAQLRSGALPGGSAESGVRPGGEARSGVAGDGGLAGRDVVLVVHGTLMRLIAVLCGAVPPMFALRNRIPNCGRIELEPVHVTPAAPQDAGSPAAQPAGSLARPLAGPPDQLPPQSSDQRFPEVGPWRCVRWASADVPLTF